MRIFFLISVLTFFAFSSCGNSTKNPEKKEAMKTDNLNTAYIGTYTKKEAHVNGQAEGIYVIYQNPEDGSLKFGETVAEITNPSYVKISNDNKYLYAVSELTDKDAASGFAYSFKINDDNSLTETGKISTEGFAPCHIAIDNSGEYIFASNYVGGVVMVYKQKEDGSLERWKRLDIGNPEESHTHSAIISPDNEHVYIADLGQNKIWIFNFDAAKGELIPNEHAFISLEKGNGPRHFVISNNGDFLYSANELDNSVSVFGILEDGGLEFLQNISSLPEDFTGKSAAADIHLAPSGKFLFVSNRGHNSIAAYEIDPFTGKLSILEFTSTRGESPRNFSIGPDGKYMYVANQDTNSISIYTIDAETGKLNPIREPFEIKTPVCIDF